MKTLYEAPLIVKPEFRLYYDSAGKVLFYTCEKPAGTYIVIDVLTFAQGRPDIRIIDGKISTVPPGSIVSKLDPDLTGTPCAADDVSIIVDETYTGKVTKWKLKTYEV